MARYRLDGAIRWRLLAATLLVPLLLACQSAPATSPGSSPSATAPASSATSTPTVEPSLDLGTPKPSGASLPAPEIPEPPHAAASPQGSIDEQAAALAAAVAPGGQQALAPLLTAYHLAGLPVIGDNGESLVGGPADPVGLPYWLVWLGAGAKPDFRLPLADATQLLVAMEDPPEFDTAALGGALLADLREMAEVADSQQRFFARFLAALAATGGSDPLDAAATADTVMLNSMALTYLMTAVLRGVVIDIVAADPGSFGLGRWLVASVAAPPAMRPPAVASAASPCNFSGTSEQVAYWTQFVASQLAAGVQLPGMQAATRSFVSLVTRGSAIAGRIGGVAGWASSVISALGLVIQLTHIDVDIVISPDPLERTKSSRRDGEQATLTAAVLFDLEGSSLDGGQGVANCLLLLLVALGIQASLPSDGRIPGATVIFEGRTGFGQGLGGGGFVQFPNPSQMRQDTNQAGEVSIVIEGIHQARDKPQYAPEWMREASVGIHSTTGAVDERSIASMFISGLTATTAGPAGAAGAIANALATVRWDIGERIFRVKDWRADWYVDDTFNQSGILGRVFGQKCDGADGQWTAQGTYDTPTGASGSQAWNIDIAMTSDTSGRGLFTYSDVQEMRPPGVNIVVYTITNVSGEIDITIDATTGVARMNARETSRKITTTTSAGGQGSEQNAPLQSWDMTWQPGDPNDACTPPPP